MGRYSSHQSCEIDYVYDEFKAYKVDHSPKYLHTRHFGSLTFKQSYLIFTMSIVAESLTNGFGPLPRLGDILGRKITHHVEADDMSVWDKGIFLNELLKQGIVLNTSDNGSVNGSLAASRGLRQGTYRGTRLALTEIYSLIEEA